MRLRLPALIGRLAAPCGRSERARHIAASGPTWASVARTNRSLYDARHLVPFAVEQQAPLRDAEQADVLCVCRNDTNAGMRVRVNTSEPGGRCSLGSLDTNVEPGAYVTFVAHGDAFLQTSVGAFWLLARPDTPAFVPVWLPDIELHQQAHATVEPWFPPWVLVCAVRAVRRL